MVSLVETSAGCFLTFSVLWQAAAADIEAAGAAIRALRAPDAAPVRLTFAPIEAPQCVALVGNGLDAFEVLASSETSGFPPYQALFNLTLDTEALRSAQLALDGRPEWFAVEYRAALPGVEHVEARARFSAERLLPWFREHQAQGTTAAALMAGALELRLIEIDVPLDGADTSTLSPERHQALLEAIASALPATIEQGETEIHIELDFTTSEDVRAFADLGVLIADASRNRIGGRHAAD